MTGDKLIQVKHLKKYYNSNGKINEGWVCLSSEFVPVGQCDSEVPLPDMINNPTVVKEKLIPQALLERGKSYYSDIYARFYGHIAKRLKKELPGKKLVPGTGIEPVLPKGSRF